MCKLSESLLKLYRMYLPSRITASFVVTYRFSKIRCPFFSKSVSIWNLMDTYCRPWTPWTWAHPACLLHYASLCVFSRGVGLICLAYLGYHVEPRWPRYWSAYSVGTLTDISLITIVCNFTFLIAGLDS